MDENRDVTFSAIVFGTDFSESAHAAGRYAALFARHYDADLIVAHAFTLVQPAMELEALTHVRSAQRTDLERLLAETVKDLAPLAGKAASVLGEGAPTDVIRAASEGRGQSLVVLGTHGGGAFERYVIGSTAEEVLRTLQDPVLTVGPHVPVPSSDRLTFRHILYATDFSPAAAHAAPYAAALARSFGSLVDVLHVAAGGTTDPTDSPFVEFGDVRERILERATAGGVDLIVLGAHHHSRLARHLRTGPAFQVIVAATCPVLTICRP